MPKTKSIRNHRFVASEFNHTLCKFCACTLGKPWHIGQFETTDAPGYQTTAVIPKPRHDAEMSNLIYEGGRSFQHDQHGPIRSESMGTDTSG